MVTAKLPNVKITRRSGVSASPIKSQTSQFPFPHDSDICGEAPYIGKAKTKFRARFNNYKGAHRSYRKKRNVSQQRFHEHYGQHSHNGIGDWQFRLTEQ